MILDFKKDEKSPILPEIDVVLHDISIIVNPRHVKIYVAKAFNIFRKVMLTENVERKNILVNVFAIPYAYGEEDKMRLVDTLHSRGHDFSVYLKKSTTSRFRTR